MLKILVITGPIYLIITAGFLSVRFGLFAAADMRALGRFVVDFCLPALLFRALSQRDPSDGLNGVYLLAYALAALLMLFSTLAFAQRFGRKPRTVAALHGLGASSSNSAFVGYPIVMQVLGHAAGVGLALTMLVENLLVMPLAVALADRGDHPSTWRAAFWPSLRGLVKNPLIVAILAALALSWSGLQLPEVFTRTVQIVATAASPVALFVIGGSLVGLRLEGQRGDVMLVAGAKLVLHPLAVLAMLEALPSIDPALRTAALLFACMPMLSMYPVLAMKYHQERFCAATLLATTLLSFFSISAWLWVVHAWLGWVP